MTEPKPGPHRFQKGHKFGKGRPKGSRNKAAVLIEKMLSDRMDALTQALVTAAEGGNAAALKMVFDRLAPIESTKASFKLPPIHTGDDAIAAGDMVMEAVGSGALSIDDGARLMALIKTRLEVQETGAWEKQLAEVRKATLVGGKKW